jgi:hypothetical protein
VTYKILMPRNVALRPNPEAARRLVTALREIGASPAVIEVAEKAAKEAADAAGVDNTKQPELANR